jgi:hypothetical protein
MGARWHVTLALDSGFGAYKRRLKRERRHGLMYNQVQEPAEMHIAFLQLCCAEKNASNENIMIEGTFDVLGIAKKWSDWRSR